MTDVDAVRAVVAAVPDPEIPVLSIGDLGMVRDVRVGEDGGVEVDITPTYSGCPATEVILRDVETALRDHGIKATVRTVLSPAWTTDWMTEEGRRRLHDFGIAPPAPVAEGRTAVPCPQCGSAHTTVLSAFGSTPCKALRRCTSCLEPFDHFKPH